MFLYKVLQFIVNTGKIDKLIHFFFGDIAEKVSSVC